MSVKRRFKVDKLIRDKVSQNLLENNIVLSTRVLPLEEYVNRLRNKILEEAQEVSDATTQNEIREELADVLEVIHAIGLAFGLSYEEIEQARIEKKNSTGGFADRCYGEFIECSASNPYLNYVLNRPEKYPEIEIS